MDCESTPQPAPAPAGSGFWWGTRARLPALHEGVRVVWLWVLEFGSTAGAGADWLGRLRGPKLGSGWGRWYRWLSVRRRSSVGADELDGWLDVPSGLALDWCVRDATESRWGRWMVDQGWWPGVAGFVRA